MVGWRCEKLGEGRKEGMDSLKNMLKVVLNFIPKHFVWCDQKEPSKNYHEVERRNSLLEYCIFMAP